MQGLDKNLVKPKRNSTIIRQQSITADEMEHLEVIIDKAEIEHRRAEKRREQGQQSMEQYNAQRAERVNEKLEQLRMLKIEHPTISQRKLAEMMSVSQSTIRNLIKKF